MKSNMEKKSSNDKDTVYIGVDPGLGITGYGVLKCSNGDVKLIDAGYIRTKKNTPIERKLNEIYEGLSEIFNEFKPESVVIEDLYSHYRHPKTAIIMGHARGAIFLSAALSEIPVTSYAATMVKKSLTGNGRASKHQMQLMVKDRLNMAELPEPPDVADALAVALCHINHLEN